MRFRRREKKRCLRRCCPRPASRSREAANRAGRRARAPALAVFVRRFSFGDAVLELSPRLARRGASGFYRVRHLPLLGVDRFDRRLNPLFDRSAHLVELVSDGAAHVLDEILCRFLGTSCSSGDCTPRLLAALRGEQQRYPCPERACDDERTDSHTRLMSLSYHVRPVALG